MEIKTAKCTLAEILLAGTVYLDSWLALSFHLFISSVALPLSLTEVCSEAGNCWYILLCARRFWDWLLTSLCCTDLLLFPWLRSASLCSSLWHWQFSSREKTLTRFLQKVTKPVCFFFCIGSTSSLLHVALYLSFLLYSTFTMSFQNFVFPVVLSRNLSVI